jgi:hypothetical protein
MLSIPYLQFSPRFQYMFLWLSFQKTGTCLKEYRNQAL